MDDLLFDEELNEKMDRAIERIKKIASIVAEGYEHDEADAIKVTVTSMATKEICKDAGRDYGGVLMVQMAAELQLKQMEEEEEEA